MPAGSIRINERLTLKENDAHGNQCITRMIHFTDNLRRLRLDTVEYAALKVIILMSSGKSHNIWNMFFYDFMENMEYYQNTLTEHIYLIIQKLMSCTKEIK